jgi:excisionase family DNA binding protein
MSNDTYMSLETACRVARLSRRQIYRLAAEGKLRTDRDGHGRKIYHAGDIAAIAEERGANQVPENSPLPVRSSDLAYNSQVVNRIGELVVAQQDVLRRLDDLAAAGRAAPPDLIAQLDRLETALAELRNQANRPIAPRWFFVVVAIALLIGALALVALVFFR